MKKILPQVVWFTGLSGSGKSTLAEHLKAVLDAKNIQTVVIDGDVLRHSMGFDLGYSKEDRSKNVARAVSIAKANLNQGLFVIVALISPFREDRNGARLALTAPLFKEVYVNTPLSECEKRDPKGLYKKAREGIIKDMTGIDSPYEPPLDPDLIINTQNLTVGKSVEMILDVLSES